jgi:hypothetical protein
MNPVARAKQAVVSALFRILNPCLQQALTPHVEMLSRRQDELRQALADRQDQLHRAASLQAESAAQVQSAQQQAMHEDQMLAMADLRLQHLRSEQPASARSWEFSCFSQWGEDGLIQFLLHRIPNLPRTFVEIGVEDYRESNTRFLLMHDNWRGLIVDSGDRHLRYLETRGLRWRHPIEAVQSFVTCENIDALLDQAGFQEGLGLLSIDIDGMDYWAWDAVRRHRPAVVAIEYNSVFGCRRAITVPYDETFSRSRAHPSNLYFGASLPALTQLAEQKGYRLICGNAAGNNAFFVRADLAQSFPVVKPEDVYRPSRFRESRDDQGRLTYVDSMRERLNLIRHLPVVDVETGSACALDSLDWETAWPEDQSGH